MFYYYHHVIDILLPWWPVNHDTGEGESKRFTYSKCSDRNTENKIILEQVSCGKCQLEMWCVFTCQCRSAVRAASNTQKHWWQHCTSSFDSQIKVASIGNIWKSYIHPFLCSFTWLLPADIYTVNQTFHSLSHTLAHTQTTYILSKINRGLRNI